jgi:leucyl-tRNA synthetase
MVFHDLGLLDFEEPYKKFRVHGLIIKDGAKMSKSKGNIVNPDKYQEKYGADALRCYLMFLGPLRGGGDFRDTGMAGMKRFLDRVWSLVHKHLRAKHLQGEINYNGVADFSPRSNHSNQQSTINNKQSYWLNLTIKRVESGIKRLKYNTSIAALMEYSNFLKTQKKVSAKSLKTLIILLAPFAPFLTEELWQQFTKENPEVEESRCTPGGKTPGLKDSVHDQKWPKYDPKALKKDEQEIVIQINGKKRATIKLSSVVAKFPARRSIPSGTRLDKQSWSIEGEGGIARQEIKDIIKKAKTHPKIKKHLKGKKVKKTIFVKNKLINFVV